MQVALQQTGKKPLQTLRFFAPRRAIWSANPDSLSLSHNVANVKLDATYRVTKTKATTSITSPAVACYPKVVLQARLIGIDKEYRPRHYNISPSL